MSWESISFWIEHHPGLASWVQAIGSLLALGVAIGVARQQGRQSQKLFRDQVNHVSEEARLQRIASLRATVEVAEIVARRVIEVARKMPDIIIEGSAPYIGKLLRPQRYGLQGFLFTNSLELWSLGKCRT